MRGGIQTPERIRKSIRTGKGIEGTDLIYVAGATLAAFLWKGNVYPPLSLVFVGFVIGVGLLAILPSRHVVNAKNYEVLFLAVFRDNTIYHAEPQPTKERKEEPHEI